MERRGYLGGRASSYLHPGTGEVIDNCQHVLFGCNTNLIGLYNRLGVSDKIFWDDHMTMIEPGGRRSVLAPSGLPAPLHNLPAILKSHCYSLADKLSLGRAFSSMMFGGDSDSGENLAEWLEAHHQTSGSIKRFWHLVIASALNAELDQISVSYARKVIRELFLNSPTAGQMGMSTVPLSNLCESANAYLLQRRSQILLNANVESATWSEEDGLWTVRTRGEDHSSEMLVLALPFEATAKLIPQMPANDAAKLLAAQTEKLQHWPICSVHLWFDREITELNHAVLLDRDIHWMYHKSKWQPQRDPKGSYVELVVSASREFAALSRAEALERATSQLAEFFPEVKQAKIINSAFIKEVRATFGVPPGIDAIRPGANSPWPNCFLAGDWTATGWPSTMESAVRSGHIAAQVLCDRVGEKRAVLLPDLPPTGFMKYFR
jgi:zeta-carotene desaturase